MAETVEVLEGYVATGSGSANLRLELLPGGRARLRLRSRWMGDDAPLDLALLGQHHVQGSHSGVVALESAEASDGRPLALPPSDGALLLEYVRVPPQQAREAGSDTMEIVGRWTETYTLVLWLHRDSFYDKGTDLPPEEYDPPIAAFFPVVRALGWLEAPWKLGPASERD